MIDDRLSKRGDVIAEEAAEYFIALKTPAANTRAEFIDWLKVSPEHVNEFLAVAAVWENLSEISSQPSPEELIRLAAGDGNVVPLLPADRGLSPSSAGAVPTQGASSKPTRAGTARGRRMPLVGVAAALVALLIGGIMTQSLPWLDPNLYRTSVGEQTSISLADGTIVTLNTQSTMRVDYSNGFRVIHLSEGEALFDVARDPARPFRVMAGPAVIEAVGTQFNVRSVARDVTVTVVEGIVDVSANRSGRASPRRQDTGEAVQATAAIAPIRLTVGQQARIEPLSGQVALIEVPAVERAIAWQQRRLVFERLSLKEVIDEFNRYNDPPIVIDDPELRDLPISGVFRSNDRESFVQFLSQMRLAESRVRGDGSIVLRRAQED